MNDLDQDVVHACADLVGRTGATDFEIGYLHDDVPAEEAAWYAQAKYQGARVIVENHRGPIEAMDALMRRLLTGAKCLCGKLVALSDDGARAYDSRLTDGSFWTVQQAAQAGQCRWRRMGPRWVRGCE